MKRLTLDLLSKYHYQHDNYNAMRRFMILKKLLKQFGIDDERVRLEWVSSAEGEKFAIMQEMSEQIKQLRPGPYSRNATIDD